MRAPRALGPGHFLLSAIEATEHSISGELCEVCGTLARLDSAISSERCREDLTDSLRGHLYACATLPEEIRLRVHEARDAAWRLVSDGRPGDEAMREAEAAMAALRETIQRTVWRKEHRSLRQAGRIRLNSGRATLEPKPTFREAH